MVESLNTDWDAQRCHIIVLPTQWYCLIRSQESVLWKCVCYISEVCGGVMLRCWFRTEGLHLSLDYVHIWVLCLFQDVNFRVWRFDYWLQLAVSIFTLLVVGRYLEPLWGSKEFFRFIIFVNFFTSTITFVLAIFLYIITRAENFLWVHLYQIWRVLTTLVTYYCVYVM